MNKIITAILAGTLSLASLSACDKENVAPATTPAPTWDTGVARLNGTVRSKQIILADPNNPNSPVACYQVVIERVSLVQDVCVTKSMYDNATPNELMTWE